LRPFLLSEHSVRTFPRMLNSRSRLLVTPTLAMLKPPFSMIPSPFLTQRTNTSKILARKDHEAIYFLYTFPCWRNVELKTNNMKRGTMVNQREGAPSITSSLHQADSAQKGRLRGSICGKTALCPRKSSLTFIDSNYSRLFRVRLQTSSRIVQYS